MKRTSKTAVAITAALNRPDVTGRVLERWSQADLLPPDGTAGQVVERHAAALADLGTQGRDPDQVALILAARGFGAKRYRAALNRAYEAGPPADLTDLQSAAVKDPAAGTMTDEDSRLTEARVQLLLDVSESGSHTVMAKLFRGIVRAIEANAAADPVRDPIVRGPDGKGLPETPAQTVRAVFTEIIRMMAGEQVLAVDAASRVVEAEHRAPTIDSSVEAVVLGEMQQLEATARQVMSTLAGMPIDALVSGAQIARVTMAATGVGEMLGPERIDLLAGILAPVGIGLVPMLLALNGIDPSSLVPKPLDETEDQP